MSKAPPKAVPAAERLRSDVDRAVAAGHDPATMTLRLTHADASQIKRDPNLDLADVSFADGEMRYLGIRVVQGGVAVSTLETGEAVVEL